MMRALADGLFSLSRASLRRAGLYLLFGLALYGVFLGGFMVRDMAVSGLRRWCESLPAAPVRLSEPRLSFLPPALVADRLTVRPPGAATAVVLRHVRAGLSFFPFGLSLTADLAGGTLGVKLTPSSLWSPERLDVEAALAGAGAEALLRPLGNDRGGLARLRGGTLDGSAAWSLPLRNGRPDPLAGEGELRLVLRDAAADVNLPMLAFNRLDKLEGNMETKWKKDRLTLTALDVRSPLLACAVQGQMTLSPGNPSAGRMDLQSVLRIPADRLRQELVPERTLQSIKNKGEVRVRVRGTVGRPSFDVQP